ncbi:hypothetical protein NQ152_10035 [Microbacterium sp. zg.B48]|uniref:hypothetical protein n=1 Tax=Microbacterium sp. zg.B48 TaxID=2969408 RepID=UPI00214C4F88|nr:hypothetical protein [Microbacterium sp. zg.B48]MCR2763845.1 hypothetical protein [Microbacterium sp. zg.B48]
MSSKIRADLNFPDEFGSVMDRFAEICDGLIAACLEVATGSGDLPDPASQVATESAIFRTAYPHAVKNLEFAPVQAATAYADSARLQLASISALLRAREVVGTLWPIVRAELEIAGRVAWLLDPTVGQPAGEVRVARYFLESISSLQRARFTTGKYDRAAEKKFKAHRDATIATAKSVFPELELELGTLDVIAGWTIHGQTILGLGASAKLFAQLFLSGPGKAMYDILSDYSHPSLVSIDLQTRLVDDGEVASHPWVVTPETVEHHCRWACTILYKTCHLICAYLRLDTGPLERWADGVPESWFDPAA